MTRRTVTVDSTPLTLNFVDPPPTATRLWSIASGQVQDEMTAAPIAGPLAVRVAQPRLRVNYGDDGAFCVVARPWLAFPPLFAPSYGLDLTLDAAGYAPLDLHVDLSTRQRHIAAPAPVAGATVVSVDDVSGLEAGQLLLLGPAADAERRTIAQLGPGAQQVTLDTGLIQPRAVNDAVVADAWTPTDLGAIGLRRQPIVLRGRAVRRNALSNTDVPVANATIALIDFWWTLAAFRALLPGQMTQANPAQRAFALGVAPGIYAQRAVGPGQLAQLTVQLPGGDDHLLLAAANAGDDTIALSNRQTIAAGTLLHIDADEPELSETIQVAAISGWGTPDRPGVATLALPLRNDHRAGARVLRALTPAPAAPPKALRLGAAPGDRCVFVADLGGLASGDNAQISGGPLAEQQRIALLSATSDAHGYFEFAPLQRIAALRLQATAAALAPLDFKFQPDYSQSENWLDVVFA